MAKRKARSTAGTTADTHRARTGPKTARTTGRPQTTGDRWPRTAARRWPRIGWLRAGIAGATLVLAGALATLLLASNGNGRAEHNSRSARQVAALLAGIPQHGRTLGYPLAPVTMQVFADLEDVDSKRWVLDFLPAIVKELVRPGILKIEYRSFKTNTIDPRTFVKQQTAAIAAGAQDKLWSFVEIFYHEQEREYTPYVTESWIDGIASQVPGLDLAQWRRDRQTGRRSEQVVADDQEGRADGLRTTPSYRLGRTGDRLQSLTGSEATIFPGQRYTTSWASAQDLAKAIKQIH